MLRNREGSILEVERLARSGFRPPNHFAIAGFLLPFAAAGLAGLLVLISEEGFFSRIGLTLYFTLIPSALLAGLFSSIKSIPKIRERGDKDYAYAGLVVNLLFLLIYLISLPCLRLPSI